MTLGNTNTIKVTYRGAKRCYLIFDTQVDCGCATCNSFTQHELIPFKDTKAPHRRFYGALPLEDFDKVLTFTICTDHRMLMNLIPWADHKRARAADLDLDIHGSMRDTKWLDSVVIEGKICKLSVEIYGTDAKAPEVYKQCYVRQEAGGSEALIGAAVAYVVSAFSSGTSSQGLDPEEDEEGGNEDGDETPGGDEAEEEVGDEAEGEGEDNGAWRRHVIKKVCKAAFEIGIDVGIAFFAASLEGQ
ncbi:hypothetical protein BGW39_006235 [Mortierella sp. 14UC]|nr:hypothetical protein BGW39_006235 [Mortierella sp. 14UC]